MYLFMRFIKRRKTISVIMVFAMMLSCFPAIPAKAATLGTVTFTSGAGISGSTVTAGQGGSTAIPGMTLQIISGDGLSWSYEQPYIRHGIAAGYNNLDSSSLITIKSSNSTDNFDFQSFFVADYGDIRITVTGYDDGRSTGSVNLDTMGNGTFENTFTQGNGLTASIFQNVDEVRITPFYPGNMWIALNDIQIGSPVQAPLITSVSPTSGPTSGGTSVTLTGTNLSGATAVKFGATAASFIVNSATSITATAPAGSSGTVDVTVTTPGGTSATTVADQYTYIAAPTITSISPKSGPTSGGTSVTLTGTNLSGATAVHFGATPATSFIVNSATSITATAPAGSGTVDVRVRTAGGTSATSSVDQYTYIAAPTITSISPTSGPTSGGTSVTLTGTNLSGATAVKFGATAASFIVNSATSITATAPAGSSGTVDVTVTTPGGISATSMVDQYTYIAAPTITSHPSSSTIAAGANTTFSVTASNATGFQWQVDQGVGFTNIANGAPYSGATTATLTITGATAGMNGYMYRVVASGLASPDATSNSAALTVNSPPSITSHPSNSTIAAGANTTFSVTASNATGYQWEVDTGAGFTNISNGAPYSGATTATLTITGATAGMNGYVYRVIASGLASPNATSNSAALTVNSPPSITSHPSSSTIVAGANTTFSVTASNATGYQWQVDQGSGFTNIANGAPYSGATTSTLTITGGTAGMNGYVYRVIASGLASPDATSNSAALTVNTIPGASIITSIAAGDTKVSLAWNSLPDTTGYKVYQSVASGTYGVEVASVGQSVYGTDITGLTNGTTYYFVVQAINGSLAGPYSNQVSAMPQVPSLGQPILQPAIAENAHVKLLWDPVPGSTGYKIYRSETIGTYGVESATVTESVYSYDVTGLINGTTYYFVVKAVNPGGDSSASNEVSAIPMTVPAAPTNVFAVAGDGKATITFTAPMDNGGSAITGYEVTASPGGVVVTGTSSPITFTGLSNGISYTFTVKAISGVGPGTSSAASNAVIPIGSSSSGGSGSPTPMTPEAADQDVLVLVNGKGENVGTATTTKVNDRTVTTVTIDQKKLEAQLAAEGSNTRVTIRVDSKPDVVIVELNGQMVKDMESKQGIIEIKTNHATYALPAEQINMDSISEKFGKQVALQDIKIRIEIAVLTADSMGVAENAAAKGAFKLVAPPISFTVKAEHAGSIVEVSRFNTYVERSIALPDGVDRNKITTGVAIGADSSVRHVPTKVIVKEGKSYAVINSLTNSTYAVVWHPLEFQDVANHWAKEAVNNMGARMVIDGTGELKFNPDRDITRAEFVAIVVRGLGLKPENGTSILTDVTAADWYSSAINTAYAYHLISGLEDGTFRPKDKISREQAMVIIAKAMEITGLKQNLAAKSTEDRLRSFTDAADASEWAKSSIADSVQAGIISGRSNAVLAPKELLTRAEVAVIIERLLQKSNLI